MKTITEYKNNVEETRTFNNLDEIKQSAIGWLEVYQDIDDVSYKNEMNAISNTNDLTVVNDVMNEFGYSYK
ncbi:hypothetical protein P3U41_05695 [Mammaliicoccus sciuri]|uniref:hypothetical protein n=1 Tax=Mammaliicoccus sciuri TaxID=1296 RepID=UPI002B25857E|nr:hypothetical protein [Mammaliicoccus sciuri]WQL34262.1 hypothetical protein P3U41_05695 [Mammaliicoccus sciuri]WQL61201.1 hypothetical protein P3T96_05695 [Mammaliicoccus sciuri]